MPEKGTIPIKIFPLQVSHENSVYCKGYLNIDVLKNLNKNATLQRPVLLKTFNCLDTIQQV